MVMPEGGHIFDAGITNAPLLNEWCCQTSHRNSHVKSKFIFICAVCALLYFIYLILARKIV